MPRILFALVLLALIVTPTGAQVFCTMDLSGDPVQDCSYVLGGDGAPIDAQLAEASRVVLRSLGSDDARTGFAGSGGDITATVVAPGFGATLELITDGGDSSGADTGGAAGDVRVLIDQGRKVTSLEIDSSGGRNLGGTGADGDAGEVAVELRGTTVERLTITAQGSLGGRVTLLLVEGATVETLVVDAAGVRAPGQVILDLDEGTRVTSVQLTPGLQTFQRLGAGVLETLRVGETLILPVPE